MTKALRVGYIPYLNMAPFHQGFGPEPLTIDGQPFEFHSLSPRALGLEAARDAVDAGALSLVDLFDRSQEFEPVGAWGIGALRAAQSVLLFSKRPIETLANSVIGVTDETSTSSRLLQVLLEQRWGLSGISFHRLRPAQAQADQVDDAVLLIGDDAWRARLGGFGGMPVVTDLGEMWYEWQKLPFVFARWAVHKSVPENVKKIIERRLENSLLSNESYLKEFSELEAESRGWDAQSVENYWRGFAYRLTPGHLEAIERFRSLLEVPCSVP